jgi:starch synthase
VKGYFQYLFGVFMNLLESTEESIKADKSCPIILPAISEALTFDGTAWSEIVEHQVTIKINFYIAAKLLPSVKMFVHWGSYDELPERWATVPVKSEDIKQIGENHYCMQTRIRVVRKGNYGATVYAQFDGCDDTHWQGRPSVDDVRFHMATDSSNLLNKLETVRKSCSTFLRKSVSERLNNGMTIEQTLKDIKAVPTETEISQVVYECTKDDEAMRRKLSKLYSQARRKLREVEDPKKASRAAYVVNVLENLGLGEVVLVAPEGPHAIAGGLAHVMIGLLKTLSQQGVKVTLISPLYEYAQGNKHRSAEELLKDGVRIGEETLQLRWVGEVEIPFGPTYRPNSTNWKDPPSRERCVVYSAESGNLRLLLLRHARYAATLYPANLGADEQLRRAIFLSRGALEVMKDPLFGVHPQNILSNDWLAALVPAFFKLDLRYSCVEGLKDAKTVHLIHNCGRDYHGRIPAQYNNADLWPLLELAPEHYQGLADPQDNRMLNLTSGAILHLNGALLAVSKPYAKQLMTSDGADGLHNVVLGQRGKIFGISNAIDQSKLRMAIHKIGNCRMAELSQDVDDTSAIEDRYLGEADFLEKLPQYKKAIKHHMQRTLGLEENEERIFITFMGRIAEQKGLSLFNGCAAGECITVLESLLLKYPNVQFVAAGPPVEGDVAANHFRSLVEYLSWKYQGRVRGVFEFIPHEYAIELLSATDFYLMPSRFEPGGITQLEALACGAVVIARNVGGLSATLHGYGDFSDKSNSFLFNDYSPTAFRDVIFYALNELRDKEKLQKMMMQAAQAQHDWGHRMPQYLALLQHLAGVLDNDGMYDYLDKRLPVLKSMQV